MTRLLSSILTAVALSAGSTATSAVLASYNFDGGSAAQSGGVLTGTDVATGTGPSIDAAGYAKESTNPTPATLALAISGSDYIEFTLSTNITQTATLDTFTFDWWLNSPEASGAQNYSVYALSDVNGFVDGQEFGSRTLTDGSTFGAGFNAHDSAANALPLSFDISALGPLTTSDSIQFRIYFADNRTGVSSPFHAVDNIAVNGTVVPEPSALSILGLGLVPLLLRRRR